jgi:hypothetical protein
VAFALAMLFVAFAVLVVALAALFMFMAFVVFAMLRVTLGMLVMSAFAVRGMFLWSLALMPWLAVGCMFRCRLADMRVCTCRPLLLEALETAGKAEQRY